MKSTKAVKINKLSVILAVLLVIVGVVAFSVFGELKRAENAKQSMKQITQTATEPPKEVKPATPEEILAEVNKIRAEVGVAPLELDERLNQSAAAKVEDMAENKYFNHVNPKTGKHGYEYASEAVGSDCISTGENLASRSPDKIDAEGWVSGWKTSKPHYEAMINPKNKLIGFNMALSGYELYYGAQHFCAK